MQLRVKNILAHSLLLLLSLVIISCEKEVSITQPKPPPEKGSIFIETSPSNIKVYLNGKYTGRNTPDSIPYLEYQTHEFRLKKNLYRDSIFYQEIINDDKLTLSIDYYTNPLMYGSIACISNPPGAQIFINDSLTGKTTPDTLKSIVPGYYKIKYTYPEHRENNIGVTVESSKIPKAELSLQDTSLWVDFQTSNSELPYDFLTDIKVDNNNKKWIGTSGLGILKYDESSFESFNPSNSSLPSGVITCIDIDEMNNVWIGTAGGFAKYDGTSWFSWTQFNSALPSGHVLDIESKDPNNIWIATTSGLLSMQDGHGYYKVYNRQNSALKNDYITGLEMDDNGKLWVSTRYGGIAYYQNGNWGAYYNVDSTGVFPDSSYAFPSNYISSMMVEPQGQLWIAHLPYTFPGGATGYALSRFDGTSWASYGSSHGLVNNDIVNIFYDELTQKKWLSTMYGLIEYRFIGSSPAQLTVYFAENTPGLFSNKIRGVAKDKNGIIWITTSGGGLTKYKGEQF
jgi:hypothetical protein